MPPDVRRQRASPSQRSSGRAPTSAAIAGKQAARHQRTRRAHSTETAEDYVETIAALIQSHGEARVVDLAACLGVSHVTVVRTVARLRRDGLVIAQPYRSIFLTDAGRRMADRSRERHAIVVAFLRAIGISSEAAEVDAEGIEHHVGPETLAAFGRYLAGHERHRP